MTDQLTPKEVEVLEFTEQGLDWRQIAEKMGVSRHTIASHKIALRRKLGARNMAHAVVLAYQRGILKGGGGGST